MYFFVHHNSSGEHHLPPINTAASTKSCKSLQEAIHRQIFTV
ncbi:hypothetical protein [Methanobrevibacter thaueri]|nr:hypothetical protein [Methanobrevibacter thaueri]